MIKLIRILLVVSVLLGWTVSSALAAAPANPNCWGVVTSQRASTLHDLGQHVSSQPTPRLGLGNVARLLSDLTGGTHVSDLGSFLASVDQIDATQCP